MGQAVNEGGVQEGSRITDLEETSHLVQTVSGQVRKGCLGGPFFTSGFCFS